MKRLFLTFLFLSSVIHAQTNKESWLSIGKLSDGSDDEIGTSVDNCDSITPLSAQEVPTDDKCAT